MILGGSGVQSQPIQSKRICFLQGKKCSLFPAGHEQSHVISRLAKQGETRLHLKTTPQKAALKEGSKAGLGESCELSDEGSHKRSPTSGLFIYLSQHSAFLVHIEAHLNCWQQEESYCYSSLCRKGLDGCKTKQYMLVVILWLWKWGVEFRGPLLCTPQLSSQFNIFL